MMDYIQDVEPTIGSTSSGRNDRRSEQRRERMLRQEIRDALSRNDLSLLLQPRYRIASPRITAVEAVIRWQHPRRGTMTANSLLPLAEKAAIICDVGRWTFAAGCQALAGLPQGIRLSLSLSPAQLREPGFMADIAEAMHAHGVAPEQLEIGLTEMALAGLDESMQLILAGLFDRGFSIAIDGFGASLGSLLPLLRVPLNRIKLDRGLVRSLPGDREGLAVVKAVADVAHALGAVVVATGVETEAQRVALAEHGCDEAQGGLFGDPLGVTELRALAT